VIWSLDRPAAAPHERHLTVVGNAVPETVHRFTVTDATSHALVEGFEPVLALEEKMDRVAPIGEDVSVAEVAARVLRFDGKPVPERTSGISGDLRNKIKEALEHAVSRGIAERAPNGAYRRLASLAAGTHAPGVTAAPSA